MDLISSFYGVMVSSYMSTQVIL